MPGHYAATAPRPRRANDHLQSIIEVTERGRPCALIAQHIQAVEGAIGKAKKALLLLGQSLQRSLRAFSSEVGTGSREENASNKSLEPPFRFNRNGKGSSDGGPKAQSADRKYLQVFERR
jgi:DNA-binding FrmR family transcriptional regulator